MKLISANHQSLITTGLMLVIVNLIKLVGFFPWWAFVVPVFILGIILQRIRFSIPAFRIGFLTGFCIWLGASAYFSMIYSGNTISKLGDMAGIPGFLVILCSSLVGGLLNGLALYSGYQLFRDIKEEDARINVW